MTRLQDHVPVLKTNVSGNEISVDNLESAQTYHAVVTAHTSDGQIVSTRKGIITTSKSMNTNMLLASFCPNRLHNILKSNKHFFLCSIIQMIAI